MSGQERLWFRPVPKKDPTGAARQRRFRERRKAEATADATMIAVDTLEMIGVAARLAQGTADRRDCQVASALIMAFVSQVPATGSVNIAPET